MPKALETQKPLPLDFPFLGRGFRPFFLLGALQAVCMLLLWGGYALQIITPPSFMLATISWHAHEMIYGFAICIIAGFLLTAVANWTGRPPVKHGHLLALCGVWIAGRVVMNIDLSLPIWLVQTISLAFIPFLALSLSVSLFKSHNKRNYIFLGVLSILWGTQICLLIFGIHTAIYVALMMIIVVISLIGGRVIPLFTTSALKKRGVNVSHTPQMRLDIAALCSLFATSILLITAPNGMALCLVACLSAGIHLIRMRRYHSLRTLSDPMLWILQAGYIWLVIGLVLIGMSALGSVSLSSALHALTVGAIGSMTIGMMVRVTLGHTGREITANTSIFIIFVLMQILAIMRVFGTLFLPEYSTFWIVGSAGLWSLCYALYLVIYAPMLMRSRPDGKPA